MPLELTAWTSFRLAQISEGSKFARLFAGVTTADGRMFKFGTSRQHAPIYPGLRPAPEVYSPPRELSHVREVY